MSIQTSLSLGDLGQCPIPPGFQFRCHQPIARVYGFVLPLSMLGLVADALQGQFQPPFFFDHVQCSARSEPAVRLRFPWVDTLPAPFLRWLVQLCTPQSRDTTASLALCFPLDSKTQSAAFGSPASQHPISRPSHRRTPSAILASIGCRCAVADPIADSRVDRTRPIAKSG